ncbi:MAG TPA: MFS transporter [Actinophytocola sp.]|jgi:DHA2 family multidrug resistance protein-like MFS transporter|nr:MFS transporter [Actinophytocola sp.]
MGYEVRAPATAGRREWLGLAVLALPTLLVSLDTFVMLLAVPHMATALGASAGEQLWIMDGYGFMVAGFMITMGTLGDRVGRRRLLLVGATAFGAASLFAAYAPNAELLILARALLGVAGAAIAPSTLSLITTMFRDPAQRTTAIGLWAGCFTVGAVVGPVVGGVLLEHFWWGSVFLLGVPAMVLLLATGRRLLPEYRDPDAGRIDVPSVVLSLGAILPVIHGLKQLAAHGPGAARFGFVVAGLAVGAVFVHRQRRLATPLLDLRLFTRRTFAVTLGGMLVYTMLAGGIMVFVAQYFQLVSGLSPLHAGLALVPGMVASTIGFQVTPVLARRLRPAVLLGAGLACAAAGILAMTQADSATGLAAAFAVASIGSAPLVTLGTGIVIGSVPPQRAGSAAGLSQTANEFGYALGIAVLGSVVTAVYRAGLPDDAPAAAGDNLAAAAQAAAKLGPDAGAALLAAARDAFTTAVHTAAGIAGLVVAGIAVLLAVTLRGLPPTGERSSEPEQAGEPVSVS